MHNPNPKDVMLSHAAMDELRGAVSLLMDLFVVHRRRWFHPDRLTLAETFPRWRGPWSKRRFDEDLQSLRQAGYLKETPDGRSRIPSKGILTGAEYAVLHA